jgi:hypothetical protein
MKKLMRPILRAALAAAALAAAGCARGGDDVWDRVGEHANWHVLGGYKQAQNFHDTIDRYFFFRDIYDPNDYYTAGIWR